MCVCVCVLICVRVNVRVCINTLKRMCVFASVNRANRAPRPLGHAGSDKRTRCGSVLVLQNTLVMNGAFLFFLS